MIKRFLIGFIGLVLFACDTEQTSTKKNVPKPTKEQLIKANKNLMKLEETRIKRFLERSGWPVLSTGTGLHYWVYEPGKGDSVRQGEIITVNYTIRLLTGDTCYTNIGEEPDQFKVDFDDVESGLHEAVQYMKYGSKARLILPPHLAHGLIGDMNKIPMNATLIYDLEILNSKNE